VRFWLGGDFHHHDTPHSKEKQRDDKQLAVDFVIDELFVDFILVPKVPSVPPGKVETDCSNSPKDDIHRPTSLSRGI
jgi:hypothetical protein